MLFFIEADDWDGTTKIFDPGSNHNWGHGTQ